MIKQRNLHPSLVQWIMQQTGLGPGIGKIKYLVPAASATSQFRTQLQEMGVEDADMFTTLATAEDATSGYRNDVILVAPGAYLGTAALAWDKNNTHMLGIGGNNMRGDWSEPNVCIYTSGVGVANVLNITGANCQFQNLTVQNYGNNAACLSAVLLNKYGCYFKNVSIQGTMTANQCTTVAAASLYIAANGMYPIFEDCTIGQNVWGTRSGALSGVLRFTGATGPQNGIFRGCDFLSAAETATVAMVAVPATACIDRLWLFENCHFENFSVNMVANLNQVFYDNCGSTHSISLRNCSAIGIDEWQDADQGNNYIGSNMPIVGTGGGLARNPTSVTGS